MQKINLLITLSAKGVFFLKRKKKKDDERKVFPIVADMLGVWEETASEDDISDYLGSYTGNPYDDIMPVQDADDL